MSLSEKLNTFRRTHEHKLELLFFVLGFALDAWVITTPDQPAVIIHQAVYLTLIALLIHFEILFRHGIWQPGNFAVKIWPYRELALHFFLGTLLNVYSIFYIKSASWLSSLLFLTAMILMIFANELPFIKKSERVRFKTGLYAICLFSFFSIIFPMIFGFIGAVPFLFAVASTLGILLLQLKFLRRSITENKVLVHALFTPVVSVVSVFALFFFLGLIPPVPLSAREQGIYHSVEKRDGKFVLSTEKGKTSFLPSWKSVFIARPGDKIYFYSQIYSPARISDEVVVHWYKEDARGNWVTQDKVPVTIRGGREEGFRVFTYKTNYEPGQWKVEMETSTGVEISRLYFEVVAREETPAREFTVVEK